MERPFLTAEWRHLVMINYEIDPEHLLPFVPAGTELDRWQDRTLVSMVGFLFLNTRIVGFSIPFHRNFEEINLRFYVRRETDTESRRGVVFIREIVPRMAIALTARYFYNENYIALPTSHFLSEGNNTRTAQYAWRHRGSESSIEVIAQGEPAHLVAGSEEEFIAQHYWGYVAQRNGGTVEYHVEHPPWRVWQCESSNFAGEVTSLYGGPIAAALQPAPSSAFLAEGSPVVVHRGTKIA